MNTLVVALLLVLAGQSSDAVDISAKLVADKLVVGKEYGIDLKISYQKGWSNAESGISQPILQIEVPDCVELAGKVLRSHRELARNEFLQAPFERLIENNSARIAFKLVGQPKSDDQISLSVLAYLSSGEKAEDAAFFRQRLTLPLVPNAEARVASAVPSDWGTEGGTQLGEKASGFELPTASGETVSLDKYLGEKNIIVTTYRAFW